MRPFNLFLRFAFLNRVEREREALLNYDSRANERVLRVQVFAFCEMATINKITFQLFGSVVIRGKKGIHF